MSGKIPLVDLRAQYGAIAAELEPVVLEVLRSGVYVGGPQVERFEAEFAAAEGGRFCAGVSSGTAALRLALMACGVQPGREVIVPAFTFIATAEAVTQMGAVPIFADIDPVTMCLDPADAARRITPKTAAVIPVHLFGHPADLDPLLAPAREAGIAVIQDACQAHGTRYRDRPPGAFGDAACYSFYPSKSLAACGEGGAVVTDREEVAGRVRRLRDHGQRSRYDHESEGFNDRLHALQAAILRVKLPHLEDWIEARRRVADRYREHLRSLPLDLPVEKSGARHSYSLFVIRSPHRDRIAGHLGEEGIGAIVHYPVPLHRLPPYAALGYREGDFPHSEAAARTVLSVPMYPELSVESMERVVRCIEASLDSRPVRS